MTKQTATPATNLNAADQLAAQAVIALMANDTNRAIVLHHLDPLPVSDIYFCDNYDIGSREMRERTEIISRAAKTPAGQSVTQHLNNILISVEQVTPAPVAAQTTPAADKVAKIQTAIAGNYRGLQKTLKALRDAQELPNTIRVNISHTKLRAIASELLNTWLLKAAEFEKQCNTLESKMNAVKAKVAAHIVTDNCTFADRILSGTETEKIWLTRRDQSKITLIKAGDFYITFAGDALRLLANMPECLALCVDRGALQTGFVAHAVDRYNKLAELAGLSLHLIDI